MTTHDDTVLVSKIRNLVDEVADRYHTTGTDATGYPLVDPDYLLERLLDRLTELTIQPGDPCPDCCHRHIGACLHCGHAAYQHDTQTHLAGDHLIVCWHCPACGTYRHDTHHGDDSVQTILHGLYLDHPTWKDQR